MMAQLEIVGARKHNLKNLSLWIPKRELVVITGVSGSGKSSLAYDTVFQEGQHKYLESLSTYARQFMKPLERPDVQAIRGIAPTISIDQKHASYYFNSTVGTISEVAPYLRLLFARAGEAHCPSCGKKVERYSEARIIEYMLDRYSGQTIRLFAPVVKGRKGNHQSLVQEYIKKGFLKALIDGEILYLDAAPPLDPHRRHSIAIQTDALTVVPGARDQLGESIRLTLHEGDGELLLQSGEEVRFLSSRLYCSGCDMSLAEPQPGTFSFQSPQGACSDCRGRGFDENGVAACPACGASGLNRQARCFLFRGLNIVQLEEMEVTDLCVFFRQITPQPDDRDILFPILPQIIQRLEAMTALSLGYISLNRRIHTLSGGELQRTRLVSQIGFSLNGIIYILDEPSIGMHMSEQRQLIRLLLRLREKGNTVIVVEHDEETIRAADYIVDMGPGAGERGGQVVYCGPVCDLAKAGDSLTADYLLGRKKIEYLSCRENLMDAIVIKGIAVNNIQGLDLVVPVNTLTVVTGVSGSGKSSLIVDGLYPILRGSLAGEPHKGFSVCFNSLESSGSIRRLLLVSQAAIGKNSRSCPATFIGLMAMVRQLFAELPESKVRGYDQSRFSFNSAAGRCPACDGLGIKKLQMGFLPHLEAVCSVCAGRRFNSETLEVKYRGHSIADVLEMTATEALALFGAIPDLAKKLHLLNEVGLGYLRLGQSSLHLSGGESQRIKLAKELAREGYLPTLCILDEPTIGLHCDDISKLIHIFQALLGRGHTLVVIEHHPQIIRAAGHLIDMGPGGGRNGGRIVYEGPVSGILACPDSITGRCLKEMTHGL